MAKNRYINTKVWDDEYFSNPDGHIMDVDNEMEIIAKYAGSYGDNIKVAMYVPADPALTGTPTWADNTDTYNGTKEVILRNSLSECLSGEAYNISYSVEIN
jgi:hypothetical protein